LITLPEHRFLAMNICNRPENLRFLPAFANKWSIAIVVFLMAITTQPSLAQVEQLWKSHLKASLNTANKAVCARLDSDKNVVVLCYTWQPDSTGDIMIIKLDPTGQERWRRIIDGPAHTDDRPIDLAIDDKNNIWVCGHTRTKYNDADILVVKVSAAGSILHTETFGLFTGKFDMPMAMTVDRAGFPGVAGYVTSPDSGINYAILRFLPTGELYWYRTYATTEMDQANGIAVDDSCNLYSTGIVNGGLHSSDILVMKHDSSGKVKWLHRYDGRRSDNDAGRCITLDDSAGAYVSGYVNHAGERADLPLLKFTRDGMLVQEMIFGCGSADCMAERIFTDKSSAQVSATFTDYAMQESGGILLQFADADGRTMFDRKFHSGVYFYRLLPEKNFRLLLGSKLYAEEGMLQPAFAVPDQQDGYLYFYVDPSIHGIAYIRDVVVDNDHVYFIGDDVGEANGTISVITYRYDATAITTQLKNSTQKGEKK
jgi:hypothetical protein